MRYPLLLLPSRKIKTALKFNLNDDGSHFFQATFLNQTWLRWNESNEGTTLFNKYSPTTFDIGLRRTRVQLFGQITDRVFIMIPVIQICCISALSCSWIYPLIKKKAPQSATTLGILIPIMAQITFVITE